MYDEISANIRNKCEAIETFTVQDAHKTQLVLKKWNKGTWRLLHKEREVCSTRKALLGALKGLIPTLESVPTLAVDQCVSVRRDGDEWRPPEEGHPDWQPPEDHPEWQPPDEAALAREIERLSRREDVSALLGDDLRHAVGTAATLTRADIRRRLSSYDVDGDGVLEASEALDAARALGGDDEDTSLVARAAVLAARSGSVTVAALERAALGIAAARLVRGGEPFLLGPPVDVLLGLPDVFAPARKAKRLATH